MLETAKYVISMSGVVDSNRSYRLSSNILYSINPKASTCVEGNSSAKKLQTLVDLKTLLFSQRMGLTQAQRAETVSNDTELPEIVKARVLITFGTLKL